MVAWVCRAAPGSRIPERPVRQKIDREVSKSTFEHLIIFVDDGQETQIWSWPKRDEPGKPVRLIDHAWHASSQNTPFLQRLHGISFRLSEENEVTLPKVTARLEGSLNAERVTRRFYDQFKIEHNAFLDFIGGITEVADREWYASLMLNRLMFIYFMQRKGFLNGEQDYLRDRLAHCQREKGEDKFYSFYRYFLLRLFHEGLGGQARNPELDTLLGRIPYLNGSQTLSKSNFIFQWDSTIALNLSGSESIKYLLKVRGTPSDVVNSIVCFGERSKSKFC